MGLTLNEIGALCSGLTRHPFMEDAFIDQSNGEVFTSSQLLDISLSDPPTDAQIANVWRLREKVVTQYRSYRPLTARQESILRFIVGFISEIGWPPSLREIGENFGIRSLRGVTVHLDAMERKGYISRPSTPRSIKILHPAYTPQNIATMVPLVKEHHTELLAEWNVERLFPVSSKLIARADGAFMVRVKGDAMAPAIMPRDLAICTPQSAYSDRQTVALAHVGIGRPECRDILVRTLYERIAGPVFVASRSDCFDIEGDFRILGKVVGLMRDYEGEAF